MLPPPSTKPPLAPNQAYQSRRSLPRQLPFTMQPTKGNRPSGWLPSHDGHPSSYWPDMLLYSPCFRNHHPTTKPTNTPSTAITLTRNMIWINILLVFRRRSSLPAWDGPLREFSHNFTVWNAHFRQIVMPDMFATVWNLLILYAFINKIIVCSLFVFLFSVS